MIDIKKVKEKARSISPLEQATKILVAEIDMLDTKPFKQRTVDHWRERKRLERMLKENARLIRLQSSPVEE